MKNLQVDGALDVQVSSASGSTVWPQNYAVYADLTEYFPFVSQAQEILSSTSTSSSHVLTLSHNERNSVRLEEQKSTITRKVKHLMGSKSSIPGLEVPIGSGDSTQQASIGSSLPLKFATHKNTTNDQHTSS